MHMGCATARIQMELMVLETRTMESAREKTQVENVETSAHSVIQKVHMMTDLMGLIEFRLRSLMKAGLLHVLGQIALGRNPQWKDKECRLFVLESYVRGHTPTQAYTNLASRNGRS